MPRPSTAQTTIQQFYETGADWGPVVRVTADARSNALIVQASPRDMAEVAELIRRIDTSTSAAVNEVRIIRLEHPMAQDVANILQSAIGARPARATQPAARRQRSRARRPTRRRRTAGGRRTATERQPSGQQQSEQRSAMLRFLTIDAKERRLLNRDPDRREDHGRRPGQRPGRLGAAGEHGTVEALVRQLDQLPAAEAQIKVFTIVNGDATNLVNMLQMLFAGRMTTGGSRAAGDGARPVDLRQREIRWCPCGSPSMRAPTASSPPARRPT